MAEPLLVSVIVPFYDAEAFLEEAIESIRRQTYTNWEMLLTDDGSSDSSAKIAKKYARMDADRIKYIEHPQHRHRGLTASRNRALESARGSYVALLDADDCWLPEKLSKRVQLAVANPDCALIGGASTYWHSWHKSLKRDIVVQVGCRRDTVVSPPELVRELYPLGKGAAPCPSSLLIKTEVLRKHKGFEERFAGIYQSYEDQAFLAKFYLNEACYMSSLSLDRYRQRSGSLVRSIRAPWQYRQVRRFFLEWLRRYLEEQEIRDPAIWKALDLASERCEHPILHKALRWGLRE